MIRRCSDSQRSPTARDSRAPASAVAVTASVNAVRALHEAGAALVTLHRSNALAPPRKHCRRQPSKASILLALAALYREIDPAAPARGRALATTALALAEDSGDTALIAAAHGEVGAASAAANDYAAALRHTRQAVLLAQSSDLRDSQYRYEWQMGRLLRALDRPADALTSYEAAVATLDTTTIAAATSRRGFRRDVLPLYEEYADLMLAQTNGRNGDEAKRRAAHRTAQSRAAARRRGTQLLREPVLRTDRRRPPAGRGARARHLSDAVRRSIGAAREQRR